ncbi:MULTISPECIES: phage tail protein [Corallococcus]|uniref:phage tail protein n=1 Tax=Corallococcus TaxID=83461 RepID=UPI000EA36B0F|nr:MULTISPECIES: phage tail protein [Corallococcus]MBN8471790.1 phage tail protein [Corallococcus exiguus]MBN9686439.1 phage tail protein [Corallococcus sp. NCSPR001]NRD44919.1 phage tail protein [Corallococcus exiguus]RKG57569.1 phage tail protein [Corallococcus sp. AB011P]RKH90120.1 phage tail protein [Corallococcus sp. AB045]
MALFSVNSHRSDPYKNFKFRVLIDGRPVAGLSKMSALKKSTEAVEWREAGDPSIVRKMPGRTKFEPITLEAGLTHDTTFEEWANLVNNLDGAAAMSLAKYRKDIAIEVLNLQSTPVLRFKIRRAWVSEYQATPEMDANANAVAITMVKIEHEGFQRDTTLTEPAET